MWTVSKKRHKCHRCQGWISPGTRFFIRYPTQKRRKHPSSFKTYRYHPICKSISGLKESRLTDNLKTFIKEVLRGPKLTAEFSVPSQVVAGLYRKCVIMGLDVYKHIFYGKRQKRVLYFHGKDVKKAVKRVREEGNMATLSWIQMHERAIRGRH